METLRYLVLVNGLLAVVSVAYYLLLRRETFFVANRLALWLGVAGSLLLPLLDLPDWRPQPIRRAMQQTARVIVPKIVPDQPGPQTDVTITFPNQRTFHAFQSQQERAVGPWQTGLLVLYIAGVLVLLIRFIIQLGSLKKLIRQSIHDPYDDFVLARNEAVTSPFSFFNWVVLHPDQHTTDELDQILRHERVHVRERHSIDMLLAEVICIVFWFNPAIYLFRHLLHQTLEFSADHAVLAEGIDAKAYQYNLLKVSLSTRQSVLTNHFSKSQLKSRIAMLNTPKSSKVAWLNYPVFFIAALTVASAFARPKPMMVFSNPISEPRTSTTASAKRLAKPGSANKKPVEYKSVGLKIDHSTTNKFLTLPIKLNMNSMAAANSELKDECYTKKSPLPQNVGQEALSDLSRSGTTDDLPITAVLTADKEMEAMVLAGQQKYGHLGIGPRRFDKEELTSQSSSGSYLQVHPDGSLSVDETASYAKIFINNEPVTPRAVRSLTINQLYTLAVIYGYKPAGDNQIVTRYILFYIDKSK